MSEIYFVAATEEVLRSCYSSQWLAQGDILLSSEILQQKKCRPECRCIFSTWTMPALTEEQIREQFPSLKYLFYGAGSVQKFARPFLKNGVRIFSAWAANAVPVAEWTAAQIILANKGFFQLHRRYAEEGAEKAREYGNSFPGNYHTPVGLLGAGMIGRKVIELLAPYSLEILVFDPFMDEPAAENLHVRKTDIETLFAESQTISNHLANNPQTRGMLNYSLFSRMKPNAVFINTGRGATIDPQGLCRALNEEPRRTAVLDVTDPNEPLQRGDPLFDMPNIILTPHRAGACSKEVARLGEYMAEEYRRVTAGKPALYEVTTDMLETMA
ncbi:MAG: phosphoglycerate dehydrogenase [Spirochaetales bacterium]|nr:MAG: phosphoglycerate dehydrogenase [Spirochaetales bacterium]